MDAIKVPIVTLLSCLLGAIMVLTIVYLGTIIKNNSDRAMLDAGYTWVPTIRGHWEKRQGTTDAKAIEWLKNNTDLDADKINIRQTMISKYAARRSLSLYRRMAKEDKRNRAHYLREAMRLRQLLRGVSLYYHLGFGKSVTIIPYIHVGSPLQYEVATTTPK